MSDDIRRWPKVELHLHLDCCLSFEAARLLEPGLSFETYREEFVVPPQVASLAEFLRRTRRSLGLLQTARGLTVATLDLMAQLQADGVVYAELRFAPLQHLDGGLSPEAVVEAVDHAVKRGIAETGVQARVLLCTLRHFSEAQSLETAELALAFRGSHVVGIDLAGDEAGFPLEAHIAAFEFAERHGLARTAHAGEARGASSVRETLAQLRPTRLGHGVRAAEDPALLAELKQAHVHLEICPTCNVQIGLFPSLMAHPVDMFYRAGLSVGVNTDTRTLTNTTLSAEYARLVDTFGWTPHDFRRCNLAALEASFADHTTKSGVRHLINAHSLKGATELTDRSEKSQNF
ncbi:adenosine deaminase [Deinococcus oregonensis]|uniref:adenosine deaminase n=1 Tax=Deinococcus oregonensis TaxID=1805970 RepID=A0ABV6B4P3_9DEIO